MNGSGDKVSPVDQVDIRKFLVAGKTFGLQQKIQWVMLAACNVITALHLVASVFISAAVNHRYTSSFTMCKLAMLGHFPINQGFLPYSVVCYYSVCQSELCASFVLAFIDERLGVRTC